MARFAVGDIQGCYQALRRLLDKASFDPAVDRLWLAGDLVNRGPDSLRVLRWARSLGDRAVVVLGNHDLHLIAMAHGAPAKRRDTLLQIREAPDGEELLDWLRHQNLMHHEEGFAMVHAGLLPEWTIAQALELARDVERELREAPKRLFELMYGDEPAKWSDALDRADRHRIVINAMTRMRMLNRAGEMDLSYSDTPSKAPAGHVSWFDVPGRASAATPIVCGHWAALGLMLRPDLLALDTGCVWGRQLTVVRLEDRAVFQIDCEAVWV
ncbi:MAG: bis(5'-nucleosyl)-tetraphosphatase (symmetrical) [Anaeromyxobacter sp. RBG_16_69_14]|nr:MAG: bis(5'-nucleosyl)-tetraphosphatase (symmetrical) [Anaeromyxobacter sp. RBG_16_69_14]